MRAIVRSVAALCFVIAGLAAAQAEKRVALIVGNSSYAHIAGLPNVPADAKAMGALFKAANFDVIDVLINLDGGQMRRALKAFAGRAADADVAVLYYAGHGIEVGQTNYLVVPAGSFMMGSPESETGRRDDEGPQHLVTIRRPFAVAKFEAAFSEWDACVAARSCYHRPEGMWGRGKQPVISVSWEDVRAYLGWLNSKIGKYGTYRLPTEAEWEYVTRAGTTTPFWWGSSITTDQANYNGNYPYGGGPKGEYRQQTMPVDSFAPNPWGLYNVHGNVWEWVQDCWNQGGYAGAPSDGSAQAIDKLIAAGPLVLPGADIPPQDPRDCYRRVLRSGSWSFEPGGLRSAIRLGYPSHERFITLGFRTVRTLPWVE